MARVERHVDINVPVSTAYNQWTQFESFPEFMDGIEEVRQIDNTHLYWVAEIGVRIFDWYATIVRQERDHIIAWESDTGVKNDGIIEFDEIDDDHCRLSLTMDYEPRDLIENIGDEMGFVERRVDGDLDRFKHFI